MNIYDMILFLILVLFMIVGFIRGLLKEIMLLLLVILPFCISIFFATPLYDFLQNNTKIVMKIETSIRQKMMHEKTKSDDDIKRDNSSNNIIDQLSVFSGDFKNKANDAIIHLTSEKILKVLSFLLVYLMAHVILSIIFIAFNIIAKIPILSSFNRFFGSILGLCKGLIIISIFLLILPLIYMKFGIGTHLIKAINESNILKILYEDNILMRIFEKIMI